MTDSIYSTKVGIGLVFKKYRADTKNILNIDDILGKLIIRYFFSFPIVWSFQDFYIFYT